MSMTALRERAPRESLLPAPVWIGVVVAFLGIVTGIGPLLERHPRADLTVVNETDWTLGVETVRGDRRSPIAHLDRRSSRTIREVLRPAGREWSVRWTFAGEEVGVSRLPVDPGGGEAFDLAVPQRVVDRLRAIDAPPTP